MTATTRTRGGMPAGLHRLLRLRALRTPWPNSCERCGRSRQQVYANDRQQTVRRSFLLGRSFMLCSRCDAALTSAAPHHDCVSDMNRLGRAHASGIRSVLAHAPETPAAPYRTRIPREPDDPWHCDDVNPGGVP